MVDLAEIQAAYYMVAATGVLVAAAFYIVNVRITLETRRIGLLQNISTNIANEEGQKRLFELMSYEWTDYEDFEKKYGTKTNISSAAKRYDIWTSFNTIGMMVRKGLVKVDDVYNMGIAGVPDLWVKYRPIIEEIRRRYAGGEYCRDLEFLAGEMMRHVQSKDPSWRMPGNLSDYVSNR